MPVSAADDQEEYAFNVLDELLEKAVWKSGCVFIRAGRITIYCYHKEMLRRELVALATSAIKYRFKSCDIQVAGVVENIIDEYKHELNTFNIYDRAPRTVIQA